MVIVAPSGLPDRGTRTTPTTTGRGTPIEVPGRASPRARTRLPISSRSTFQPDGTVSSNPALSTRTLAGGGRPGPRGRGGGAGPARPRRARRPGPGPGRRWRRPPGPGGCGGAGTGRRRRPRPARGPRPRGPGAHGARSPGSSPLLGGAARRVEVEGAEALAQPGQGAVAGRLDRAHGQPEEAGDLGLGEVLLVAEDEYGPLAGRQGLDGLPQDHGPLAVGRRNHLGRAGPAQGTDLDRGPAQQRPLPVDQHPAGVAGRVGRAPAQPPAPPP